MRLIKYELILLVPVSIMCFLLPDYWWAFVVPYIAMLLICLQYDRWWHVKQDENAAYWQRKAERRGMGFREEDF